MRQTILLVDDSKLIQKLYEHKLSLELFRVLVAGSGEEGLALLAENRPDLILLDLCLPGIDGFQVLEKLKQAPSLREIPVIAFSGRDQVDEVSRALEMGADDFIVKTTTTAQEVVLRIKKVLGSESGRSQARCYRLGLDPISLDAREFARALGSGLLACESCSSGLALELTPQAPDEQSSRLTFRAEVVCPSCGKRAAA